jgi:hypothetical protein
MEHLLKWPMLCIIVLIFFAGCSTELKPDEYITYIDKNRDKFCKRIERNGFITTICYQPVEYYAARQMQIDPKISVQEALNKFSNTLIFTCNVKAKNIKDDGRMVLQGNGFADYGKNVKRHTFGKREDIFLVDGEDTVQVADYHYERNWGIGNGDTFVMSFAKHHIRSNLQQYNLRIRNMLPEIGTIDIKVAGLLRSVRGLKD